MTYKVPPNMKMVSVRLPMEEAERIDSLAKSIGINRTDYIRLCLKDNGASVVAEEIMQLIDVLRQLTIMMDTYLSILDRLVRNLAANDGRDGLTLTIAEIERAQELMELLFKAQRQAVRTLRSVMNDGGK